jgi:hypothetical protein
MRNTGDIFYIASHLSIKSNNTYIIVQIIQAFKFWAEWCIITCIIIMHIDCLMCVFAQWMYNFSSV